MTKKDLFLKLANPDGNKISRWVNTSEFIGKYKELHLGNGGSWFRGNSSLAKEYIVEFDTTITSGNKIDRIRLNGKNMKTNIKIFLGKFLEIKEIRQSQISNIYSLLSKYQEKISTYNNETTFNKLLIDNLLTHSIVMSVSAFQGFLEEIIEITEIYILDSNISIKKINKSIYNLFYSKHKTQIIRDFLVYGEDLRVNTLGTFIPKNKFGNIELQNGTSNTLNYSNIKEILSIILINIDLLIGKIDINIIDYKNYIDHRIGDRYILDIKHKKKFFNKIIRQLTDSRHEIVHGKKTNMSALEIYNLFLLVKNYIFDKLFIEIEMSLKVLLREKKFFS